MHLVMEGPATKPINAQQLHRFMRASIKAAGMTLISGPIVARLPGGGFEGIAILAESHVTVCVNQDNYIFADLFSCQPFNPAGVLKLAQTLLGIRILKWSTLERGLEFLPSVTTE